MGRPLQAEKDTGKGGLKEGKTGNIVWELKERMSTLQNYTMWKEKTVTENILYEPRRQPASISYIRVL